MLGLMPPINAFRMGGSGHLIWVGQSGQPTSFPHDSASVLLQVVDIKQAADYVAQLRRVGPGHGSWDWDRALLNGQPPATPADA